jgi:hypothetical protein
MALSPTQLSAETGSINVAVLATGDGLKDLVFFEVIVGTVCRSNAKQPVDHQDQGRDYRMDRHRWKTT